MRVHLDSIKVLSPSLSLSLNDSLSHTHSLSLTLYLSLYISINRFSSFSLSLSLSNETLPLQYSPLIFQSDVIHSDNRILAFHGNTELFGEVPTAVQDTFAMSDMSEDVIAHIHSLAYTQLVSEERREEAERERESEREKERWRMWE